MSELKLLPCPFCGSPARVVLDYQDIERWAQCTKRKPERCVLSTAIIEIAKWNRRTQPEATKPAQDLGAAILAIHVTTEYLQNQDMYNAFNAGLHAAAELVAALASPADALSAPIRTDIELARKEGRITFSGVLPPQHTFGPTKDVSTAVFVRASNIDSPEFIALLDDYARNGNDGYEECYKRILAYISARIPSPADALVAGDDDPIGDLQAEARQEKLDDFIASMNPNPASKNKVQAAGDVLAERERQKQQEGWTPERDDKYIDCELARAAATYSLCTDPEQIKVCGAPVWPWPIYWWKPTTYRRNLVKAGALILAEIERLDRAAIQAQKDGQ